MIWFLSFREFSYIMEVCIKIDHIFLIIGPISYKNYKVCSMLGYDFFCSLSFHLVEQRLLHRADGDGEAQRVEHTVRADDHFAPIGHQRAQIGGRIAQHNTLNGNNPFFGKNFDQWAFEKNIKNESNIFSKKTLISPKSEVLNCWHYIELNRNRRHPKSGGSPKILPPSAQKFWNPNPKACEPNSENLAPSAPRKSRSWSNSIHLSSWAPRPRPCTPRFGTTKMAHMRDGGPTPTDGTPSRHPQFGP